MPTEYVDTYYKRTLSDPQPAIRPWRPGKRRGLRGGRRPGRPVGRAGTGPARPAGHAAGRQPHRLGASGRNGGSVSPAFSAGADAIRRHVDEDHYRALYRLSMEGVEIIRANIRDLDIRDAHKVDGRLRVVRYDAGDALQRWCDEQQQGFRARRARAVARPAARAAGDRGYFQGVDDPTSFHFHPLNYARALARSARGWACASTRIRRRSSWRWTARSSRSPPPAAGSRRAPWCWPRAATPARCNPRCDGPCCPSPPTSC